MRKLAVAVMFVCLFAVVANAADLRLYFSKQGDTSGIPAEWTGSSTPTYGPGDSKIFLWAKTEKTGTAWDIWNGLAVNVDKTPSAGIAYNPENPDTEFIRWNPGSDLDFKDGGMFGIAITEAGLGSGLDPLRVVEGTTGRHYLVAELSFPTTSTYDVFMAVGEKGIARKGGSPSTDKIYFGFGDAGLLGTQAGAKSTLPDLKVIPEPASLALLGLAVLALRRR